MSLSVVSNTLPPRLISVAPMMDRTDRHFRYLQRLISRHTWLYTEMVTTGAILQGGRNDLLAFDPAEHPLALQLGGSQPGALARCARIAEQQGYDEVNLNVGCPSDRVQSGRFGACLMTEPELVAECVAAMRAEVSIPVTVKTRIGVDDRDAYEDLSDFVERVAAAGCRVFIIHARKAWLQGLSPKQNREIPPLRYELVHRLKRDFPDLQIVLNGGLTHLHQFAEHLRSLDGVMIGRAAYHNPYLLAPADVHYFGAVKPPLSRHRVIDSFLSYVERELTCGVPLATLTRPLLGLFQGLPGARAWRRHLSEHAHRQGAGIEVIEQALRRLSTKMEAPEGVIPSASGES